MTLPRHRRAWPIGDVPIITLASFTKSPRKKLDTAGRRVAIDEWPKSQGASVFDQSSAQCSAPIVNRSLRRPPHTQEMSTVGNGGFVARDFVGHGLRTKCEDEVVNGRHLSLRTPVVGGSFNILRHRFVNDGCDILGPSPVDPPLRPLVTLGY